jgi:glycosyltransferase involved in cell wall biosynthesis
MDVDNLPPRVMHLTIYPAEGATHSSAEDLSALAGYTKALFSHFAPAVRRRHVVVTNKKTGACRRFSDEGLEVWEAWDKGSWRYPWQILQAARNLPEHRVVHLQHEFNQFGGAMTLPLTIIMLACLRWVLRRRIIITLHEVLSLRQIDAEFLRRSCIRYPAWLTRWVVRFYYGAVVTLADVIVVQDEHFACILREEYRARGPIRVVRIGTDTVEPPPLLECRHRWGLPADGRVALFFGTLDWRKGLDLLVEAWSLLPAGFCTLLIAGGKPMRVQHTAEYQAWLASLEGNVSRTPDIRMLGFIADPDMPSLFGAADVVVLPYVVPQRVSAVFNQAASCGVPLIASDAFAAQAEPAMVFEQSPAALADKIQWALREGLPELRAAAIRFRDEHSWARSAAMLADTYRSVAYGGAACP